MRLLIVGDYPGFFGGVTNYTRPLAEELSKSNDVYYLYSCTRTYNYDFFSMRISQTNPIENSNVKYFEFINPPTRYFNYNNLGLDYGEWINKLFIEFLNKIKPEVIHIHEIFGLSSNIISLAKQMKIKVFVTVHEYWWLCPHRVMVDFNKRICDGPVDINKCTHCVSNQKYIKQSKLRIITRNNVKWLHTFYLKFIKRQNKLDQKANLDFGSEIPLQYKGTPLYTQIESRLMANIGKLNECDKIIGVSNDVLKILVKYGVKSDKIIVNHIGTTIANNKIIHNKMVNSSKIIFGFIGGVSYYKGVHQLVRAFLSLANEEKERAEVLIYGKYDEAYFKAMNNEIMNDKNAKERIKFLGKYVPNELVQITNSIDISVLPSLCADTAPQTIFESFNAGLPIIAPNIGGFPDFVINDYNGLLYASSSIDSLKDQMVKVIKDSSLIDKFKSNIPTTKGMSSNVEELLELYSK